jgi:hypothetical protein
MKKLIEVFVDGKWQVPVAVYRCHRLGTEVVDWVSYRLQDGREGVANEKEWREDVRS